MNAPIIKSIGIHIFAGAHELARDSRLADVFSEGIAAVSPLAFSHFFTIRATGHPRGSRKFKDTRRLVQDWQIAGDEMVVLMSQHGHLPIMPDEAYADLVFSRSLDGSAGDSHRFLNELSLGRTDFFTAADETHFVQHLCSIFELCAGRYSIVHAASCDMLLRSEVHILRGNPVGYLPEEYIFDRSVRLRSYRPRFGEIIAGANWGVMIDRALVDQLGGLARVQREAPVYRVTELAAGAVFMQATARPMPLTDLELQRVLPEFEAYLEPISAPIGPYFRTRYAK